MENTPFFIYIRKCFQNKIYININEQLIKLQLVNNIIIYSFKIVNYTRKKFCIMEYSFTKWNKIKCKKPFKVKSYKYFIIKK